jgi:hypothetical protein
VSNLFIGTAARVALAGAVACGTMSHVQAQIFDPTTGVTNVNIQVAPIAELAFTGSTLLYLKIPPAGSTIPSSGVGFVVTGNASATLVAEPTDFIAVPGEGIMGKAVLNGEAVGYKIELRFPSLGVIGSPPQYAALPLYEEGPTVPPLSVNLMMTGGARQGMIHMEAHPNWTASGGIPLPGIYVGDVTLTLTADN